MRRSMERRGGQQGPLANEPFSNYLSRSPSWAEEPSHGRSPQRARYQNEMELKGPRSAGRLACTSKTKETNVVFRLSVVSHIIWFETLRD